MLPRTHRDGQVLDLTRYSMMTTPTRSAASRQEEAAAGLRKFQRQVGSAATYYSSAGLPGCLLWTGGDRTADRRS